MRFIGLDIEEKTPVIKSFDQISTEGVTQIATLDNIDRLTDLLIAGKQSSLLSSDTCIQGRQKTTVDLRRFNPATSLFFKQRCDCRMVRGSSLCAHVS